MLAEYVTNSRIGIGNVPMETITTLSSNQLPVQTSLQLTQPLTLSETTIFKSYCR